MVSLCGMPFEIKPDFLLPDDVNVHEVLQKGLSDLMDLCDAVQEKFETAKEAYSANAGA